MRRYPGLSPFSTNQRNLFFGREEDIRQLSSLIFVERKVTLYSKSGYGKTSLLNAGVIPQLAKNQDFEFIHFRFRSYTQKHDELQPEPSQTFLNSTNQHPDFKDLAQDTLIDKYALQQQGSFWSLFKKNQLAGNDHKTYILIFDQFEELFTYPADQVETFKNNFADIILFNNLPSYFEELENKVFNDQAQIDNTKIDLLYVPINIKAVFSIRSDRLSELNTLADKIKDIQKVFYELNPLDREKASMAITLPTQLSGNFESKSFSYHKDALKKILDSLDANHADKIEPAQLQIVCQRIEDGIIEKNTSNIIIHKEDIPDVKYIFKDFYKEVLKKISQEERITVRKLVEDKLISEGRRISVDELAFKDTVEDNTLTILVNLRLLRAEKNTFGRQSFELSHDTLVGPILELAEKRREEEEKIKLRQRQRKQILITIISILVSAISIGAAIFGFWQKGLTEEANILLEEKNDSLDTQSKELEEAYRRLTVQYKLRDSLNFQRYYDISLLNKSGSNYREAILNLEFALRFDTSKSVKVKITSLIRECEAQIANEREFNQLISVGDSLKDLKIVLEADLAGGRALIDAKESYKQAKNLGYDNRLASQKLRALERDIETYIRDSKDKVKYLINGNDFTNALKVLKVVLLLRPDDKESNEQIKRITQ